MHLPALVVFSMVTEHVDRSTIFNFKRKTKKKNKSDFCDWKFTVTINRTTTLKRTTALYETTERTGGRRLRVFEGSGEDTPSVRSPR